MAASCDQRDAAIRSICAITECKPFNWQLKRNAKQRAAYYPPWPAGHSRPASRAQATDPGIVIRSIYASDDGVRRARYRRLGWLADA
jgi:hypothetical protein